MLSAPWHTRIFSGPSVHSSIPWVDIVPGLGSLLEPVTGLVVLDGFSWPLAWSVLEDLMFRNDPSGGFIVE